MTSRQRATQRVYVTLLAMAAMAGLFTYASGVNPSDWLLFIVLSVAGIALGLYGIHTSALHMNFDFNSALRIFALLVGGLPVALWSTAIGTLTVELLYKRRLMATVVNVSQHTLSVLAAGLVYRALGGLVGADFNHPIQAFGAALVLMLVNICIMFLLLVIMGRSVRSTAHFFFQSLSHMHYMVSVVLGVLASFVHIRGNYLWTSAVLIFVLLLWFTFKRYFENFGVANRQRDQLEAVLHATHSAIVMADSSGHIRVANLRYAELMGVPPERLIGERLGERMAGWPGNNLVQAVNAARKQHQADTDTSEEVLTVSGASTQYYHWYRGPVYAATDRQTEGVIEVLTDVTAERAAQEELRQIYLAMIHALTAAVDARDAYTHGHSARVAEYAVSICKQLGYTTAEIEQVRFQGLLHDVGKIGIDDRVLRKRGPLSPAERAIMMEHPVIGARILDQSGVFKDLIPGVLWHHEWINGGGYPHGLRGDEIPRDARILCVADAFDAMTSDRPYRRALTPDEALARLNTGRGVQFDPVMVDALQAVYLSGNLQAEMHHVHTEPNDYKEEEVGWIRPVHGKELNIVYQVSKENQSRLSLNRVVRRFLEIFYDTIGQNTYRVFLKEQETDHLLLLSMVGGNPDVVWSPVKMGEGTVGSAARSGKTLCTQKADHHAGTDSRPSADARSELAVPLWWNGEVIGVLHVASVAPNAFTKDDIYLFEALSQQLASAIELARYHERVVFAAEHDGLTGAYNHSVFYERLTREMTDARLAGRAVSVVIMDLDGLKMINDTYGHLAGDQALRGYAEVLRAHVREHDTLSRYGGDEFALILPGMDKSRVFALLEEMKKAAQTTMEVGGKRIPLPPASYGVATFPRDADRPSELVALADKMMYANKTSERVRRQKAGMM